MPYNSMMTPAIMQALCRLSTPIYILDRNGMCLYPAGGGQYVLPDMPAGSVRPLPMYGNVFLPLSANNNVILMAQQQDGTAGDVLLMVDSMLTASLNYSAPVTDAEDVYRSALREEVSGAELELLAQEHRIELELQRGVVLFQLTQARQDTAMALLSPLIPCGDTDVLVEIDRHAVVLLKDLTVSEDEGDLLEFIRAVSETVLEETGVTLTVGVGDPRGTLSELGESYREAQRAITVGRTFRPQESIFEYNRLMLERFLIEIPYEVAQHYHALLFNRKTARLINEDMLATIDMFFQKDLNLSDTARQLFIHRNTLVYRLDKVQRLIGLDLRKFGDAVTFKLLYELKRSGQERSSVAR